RALKLAEPEGYVRIFVDEGPALAALLGRMTRTPAQSRGGRSTSTGAVEAEGGRMAAYIQTVLAAFQKPSDVHPPALGLPRGSSREVSLHPASQYAGRGALIEPLTGRELELLRLLATSLTGPEIARQLMVSL